MHLLLPCGATRSALPPLLLPPLPDIALLSKLRSSAKVKEKERERGRRKGKKTFCCSLSSTGGNE
jgi:hypothetical protein